MKIEKLLDNKYEIHYDSPMDMLDDKPSTSNNADCFRGSSLERLGRRHEWAMVQSFDEFVTKVRHGWPELMALIERYEQQLSFDPSVAASMITQIKRRQVRRDSGDTLDFDEWRRGNVDTAWQTTERHKVEAHRQRAAVIDVQIYATCAVNASDMLWRTALAHLVAKRLVSAGWSVEIIASNNFTDLFERERCNLFVTSVAKPSTVPLSLERLAVVTSPAWFRGASFLACASNNKKFDIKSHFGMQFRGQPPYVTRLVDRGYLALTVDQNSLSRSSAQRNLDDITKQIEAHA